VLEAKAWRNELERLIPSIFSLNNFPSLQSVTPAQIRDEW
jgi:hypothetical protein